MRIDIWSDVVCPWCYIGKRRFDQGLAAFEHRDQVEVVYHSFELDPAIEPGRGSRVLDMLSAKYGMSAAQAAQAEQRVAAMAAADGLGYTVDRVVGNTFDAHRLMHLAASLGRSEQLLQRLYQAYFAESRSVFDAESLAALAADAGLEPGEARSALDDGSYADAVRADEKQASEVGITGVPFYVIDWTYGFSGAQPAEVLTEALREAWAARPAAAAAARRDPTSAAPASVAPASAAPPGGEQPAPAQG
jgi:predicted DsbA family dithiol-disulfide isomerase